MTPTPEHAVGSSGAGQQQVLASAFRLGGTTLASRVLGLARDSASAALFGTGMVWDAFLLAFTLPNLLRNLFGEGALAAAVVPEMSAREAAGDMKASQTLCSAVLGRILVFLSVLTVLGLGVLAAVWFWPGLPEKGRLFVLYAALLLPYLPIICATALLAAALQVAGRFGTSAMPPIVQNVLWIAGVAVLAWTSLSATNSAAWVAGLVVVGGLAGLAHLWWALERTGRRVRPAWNDPSGGTADVGRRMAPTVLGLAVVQINVAVDRIMAEGCVPGDGAVSALYFGHRLLHFPLALVGFALATAAFPAFSRHVAQGKMDRLDEDLSHALRQTVFLALPAAVGLTILATPLVEMLFGRGAFGAESVARTAGVVWCYGPGVLFLSVLPILTRALYSLGDHVTPVRQSVIGVVANVALNFCLVWPMAERGLALSTTVVAAFNCLGLYWVLGRRWNLGLSRDLRASGLRALAASCIMAAALVGLSQILRPGLTIILGVPLGAMLYLGAAAALGSREPAEMVRAVFGGGTSRGGEK